MCEPTSIANNPRIAGYYFEEQASRISDLKVILDAQDISMILGFQALPS